MSKEKEDVIKQAIKDAKDAADKEAMENASDEAVEEIEEVENTAKENTEDSDQKEEAKKEKKAGKNLFKEKKKEKDKSKEMIEQLEDKVKRQLAEFENFRTRTEREKAQMFDMGAKSVLEKILPVVDNFERGLTTAPTDEESKPFVDGMQMIYKQLLTEMENIGVKPIEAVGKEFDPNLHNAVMQVESEEFETGVIAQEFQKGYTYKDTVIRHSMVGVVQ